MSYASPAYYADRLCERGRCYLRDFFVNTPQGAARRNQLNQYKRTEERRRAGIRATQYGSLWNGNVRHAKTLQEQTQEANDRKAVIDDCVRRTMASAEFVFYKNGRDKNPWRDNIAQTMFWM
ncbi:hypothetical protein E8E11_000489 [Didymella keratinophila]|nr:hypothetical protein E8E11_000489 [Didymella keratinophila]